MSKSVRDAHEQDGWQRTLERYAPSNLEQSARALGALKQKRGISSANVLLRVILAYAVTARSLAETAAWASALGIAHISTVAIRNRVKGAKHWLGHLVAQQLLRHQLSASSLAGLNVLVMDATGISIPGSKGTDYRVHLGLDLRGQATAQLMVTDAHGGESLGRFRPRRGSLVMGDAGYAHRSGIAAIVAAGAHVLVRANWRNLPLRDTKGQPIDLVERARQCRANEPLDVAVEVAADEKRGVPAVPARLIIARKPPEAAERARRKLHKDSKRKGYTPTQKSLEAQDYVFLLTTMSAEMLPAKVVLALYRLRWQIEIHFKRQKSLLKLDEVLVRHPDVVQAVLNAKLLAALWAEQLLPNWEQALVADVADPDAVMAPRWRMLRLLWEALVTDIGVHLSIEEWLNAPITATRRLVEPPRRRTRERNARMQQVFAHLQGCPQC